MTCVNNYTGRDTDLKGLVFPNLDYLLAAAITHTPSKPDFGDCWEVGDDISRIHFPLQF